jgi:heme oxygenase
MTNDLSAMTRPDTASDARSLRRRLRTESRESHERLDARFDGMTGEAEPNTYARFLQVNEACHRVLEPILSDSALRHALPGFAIPHRSPALAADLSAMGLMPLEATAFPLAGLGVPEAVGVVYVLEGSRLGAGYILAEIRKREPNAAWSAASFAYLEGPDVPHALRGFLIEANAFLQEEADVSRAVAAADATFRYFLDVETLSREPARPRGGADR